jgi:hypothetical protein
MAVQDILKRFVDQEQARRPGQPEEVQEEHETESRLDRLHQCFADIVLPAVYETERDLKMSGYWHRITIGQSTSLVTSKQHTREAMISFYPEKGSISPYSQKAIDISYKAIISAATDLRNIVLSIQLPRRLPPAVEVEEAWIEIAKLDASAVDAFMEKFISNALDAYASDRLLV